MKRSAVARIIAVFGMGLVVRRVPHRETLCAVRRIIAVCRMGLGVRRVPDRKTR